MQAHRTDRAVPTPEAVLALGQQTLASQPFSQLLGAQLTALTAEGVSCGCLCVRRSSSSMVLPMVASSVIWRTTP